MTGVDKATQQRITDKAYALFVSTLTAAGFEVVDQAELAKLAPEFAKWESSPNFSVGRYGAYVAPTGLSLRFLRGDAAKRDTSGIFGNLSAASRTFDSPLAFSRSPYVAHDAHLGLIAVTLVVDFGTFTRSTPGGNALTTFSEGVAIGAGNVLDSSSLLYYWGTDSGGFPAHAHVQKPIQSKLEFADVKRISETIKKGVGSKIVTVTADPLKFETAADEVVGLAIPKLVNAIYVSK